MQPLGGMLVVDFSRYLPGAFASRELLELGARVVCVEPPGGDPMRSTAPAWDAALRAGKESLEVDLKRDAAPALELLREADVVLESFRPGVASRLGIGPKHAPDRTVYCSITGFGLGGRHRAARRSRPQLPRLGRRALGHLAGVAARPGRRPRRRRARRRDEDPRRAARARTHRQGRPRRRLDDARLASPRRAPPRRRQRAAPAHRRPRLLPDLRDRGRTPSHRRRARACLLPPPDGATRPAGVGGTPVRLPTRRHSRPSSRRSSQARPLAEWLELFDAEDVCVGPVATLAEAASDLV